jgi:hypothetical protein
LDPLVVEPGTDHPLAIGSEMRFFSIYDHCIGTAQKFKNILLNDRLRRWFILDADIEEANLDMIHIRPKLDQKDGLPVQLEKYGGNRRVDRILYHKTNKIVTNFF